MTSNALPPLPTLEFSVRTSAQQPYGAVRTSVAEAMNLTFTEGEHDLVDADVAPWLGMAVALFRWADAYLLESRIEDPRFLPPTTTAPLEPHRISAPLATHLTALGPFPWRPTTESDLRTDREYGARLDRALAEDSGAPPWADRI